MGNRRSIPTCYADADALLGARDRLNVANHTRLERSGGSAAHPGGQTIGLRLHATIVVRWCPNGDTELDTGGWQTVTTRDRINRALAESWRVGTDRGTAYLYGPGDWESRARYLYEDGVVIHADGTTDATPKPKRRASTRPRAPHRPSCACVACTARDRSARWRTSWAEQRPEANADEYGEVTRTPEATVYQDAGVTGDRWAEYNRKFNDLLMRGKEPV